MRLTTGQTFAGYTIVRLLGAGGMGEVYLAQHPRLPRRDALKLLPHDWSADADYRARFSREADLASTLWHPHIVGVHDRGEEDGQLWISMDFVDGLDAARLLADRYPTGMPVEDVARIITAVASALDYAHKQGLLHRDIKPANIMMTHLDDDGEQRILLTDFGIARNVNDISGLTRTNMTVGTVAYCAPEQLLGEDIDGRADQYSLAATAFHLLTGSYLFPRSNPAVVISRHLNNQPPALADKRPELAKLDAILSKGLAKRPQDRFNRCSDFARALNEQINPGVPTSSAPTASAPSAVRPTDASPSHKDLFDPRKRWKLWVAALVVVAALGGVSIYLGNKKFNNTAATSTTTTTIQLSPTPSRSSPAPTTTADPSSATPIVGEVPGEPEGAAALRPWVRDLVSLSTAALAAKCWTIAPDSAKRMYADTTPILNAVRDPGFEGQYGVFWKDETTRVSVRSSEIRSGYACPYVETNTGGNHLTPNDAEYVVQRYLSRVVGKPVSPDDVESRYSLECNNLSPVARQLLGKVTSFEVNSIRSNGDLDRVWVSERPC
jgi:serine/threonine-protein kinase